MLFSTVKQQALKLIAEQRAFESNLKIDTEAINDAVLS